MDSQLFAVMAGGGQSDAILRANNNDGSDVATNFQRLFQDHPDFTYLQTSPSTSTTATFSSPIPTASHDTHPAWQHRRSGHRRGRRRR